MATVNGLSLRRVLGRDEWGPPEPFGPDGWQLLHHNGHESVIVTTADHDGGPHWTHASMTRHGRVPDYADLVRLKAAVWGPGGWAMQVIPPEAEHVNIHPHALHLWGLADGSRPECIPDFGVLGTI